MNWRASDLFQAARENLNDEGVFSPDQIKLLQETLEMLEAAVDKAREPLRVDSY